MSKVFSGGGTRQQRRADGQTESPYIPTNRFEAMAEIVRTAVRRDPPPVTELALPPEPKAVKKPVAPKRPDKAYVQHTSCCGFKYIHGIQNVTFLPPNGEMTMITPEQIIGDVRAFMENEGHRYFGGVFAFVDASVRQPNGENLKKYIEDNDFGTVIKSEPNKNMNSGYELTTYIWNINHGKFKLRSS